MFSKKSLKILLILVNLLSINFVFADDDIEHLINAQIPTEMQLSLQQSNDYLIKRHDLPPTILEKLNNGAQLSPAVAKFIINEAFSHINSIGDYPEYREIFEHIFELHPDLITKDELLINNSGSSNHQTITHALIESQTSQDINDLSIFFQNLKPLIDNGLIDFEINTQMTDAQGNTIKNSAPMEIIDNLITYNATWNFGIKKMERILHYMQNGLIPSNRYFRDTITNRNYTFLDAALNIGSTQLAQEYLTWIEQKSPNRTSALNTIRPELVRYGHSRSPISHALSNSKPDVIKFILDKAVEYGVVQDVISNATFTSGNIASRLFNALYGTYQIYDADTLTKMNEAADQFMQTITTAHISLADIKSQDGRNIFDILAYTNLDDLAQKIAEGGPGTVFLFAVYNGLAQRKIEANRQQIAQLGERNQNLGEQNQSLQTSLEQFTQQLVLSQNDLQALQQVIDLLQLEVNMAEHDNRILTIKNIALNIENQHLRQRLEALIILEDNRNVESDEQSPVSTAEAQSR